MNFYKGNIITNGDVEYEVKDIQKNSSGDWCYIFNDSLMLTCEEIDKDFVLSECLSKLKKHLDSLISNKLKKIAYNMVKKDRNKTIDIMINLLEFAKQLPIFTVNFKIKADNNNIETYLLNNIDTTDWNGKPLDKNEINRFKDEVIGIFYNSEDYNPDGISVLKVRKTFTIQDINYNDIYKIVSGQLEDFPKDYEFLGEIEFSLSENLDNYED